MKAVARSYLQWPALDQNIELLVSTCQQCQDCSNSASKETNGHWVCPQRPFEDVHTDFAEYEGQQYLNIVDAFSKWTNVHPIARDTIAGRTVECLLRFIASYEIPRVIVSDNGPQFTSKEFQCF